MMVRRVESTAGQIIPLAQLKVLHLNCWQPNWVSGDFNPRSLVSRDPGSVLPTGFEPPFHGALTAIQSAFAFWHCLQILHIPFAPPSPVSLVAFLLSIFPQEGREPISQWKISVQIRLKTIQMPIRNDLSKSICINNYFVSIQNVIFNRSSLLQNNVTIRDRKPYVKYVWCRLSGI